MRQRCVDGIARNAARLVAIVTELLEIARARGGRLALARVRCDAAALAREAGADESRTEGPLIVEADARRLATILREMVLDARERARDRGPVRIEATARDGEAIVEVEDPAPAVGAEFLERAFQGARRPGGHNDDGAAPRGGLGLLLAREVIERLGGRTYARSGPAGNVLGLALPLAR
jgi:signal transduction histidine kinase